MNYHQKNRFLSKNLMFSMQLLPGSFAHSRNQRLGHYPTDIYQAIWKLFGPKSK
jgi:hypothetical protein